MSSEAFNWSCKHTWSRSAKNTFWCLLGCSIGDFGTILFFKLTKIPFTILDNELTENFFFIYHNISLVFSSFL